MHPTGGGFSQSEGTLNIWDADTGRRLPSITGRKFAFSPDGKTFAAMEQDRRIHIRNMATGAETLVMNSHWKASFVRTMSFSPNGKTLAIVDYSGGHRDKHRWRISDVQSGAVIAMGSEHEAPVRALAFSKSGDALITGSEDTTIVVRKLPDHVRNPKPIDKNMHPKAFAGTISGRGNLVFSPDGKRVVSPVFTVHDMKTMKTLHSVGAHRSSCSFAWSGDSRRLLAGPYDGTIQVWDPTTYKPLKKHVLPRTSELNGPGRRFIIGKSRMLAASPDCSWAVCNIGESYVLWTFKIDTGQVGVRFSGHTGPVRCAAVSADARKMVSGARDNTVRVWDAATGKCLHKFTGHSKPVQCVAFSPDGRYAVSGSDDDTLRVWDLKTGKQKHCLKGHVAHVACLAVTPDGRRVVSGAWEEVLRLWDIETGRQIPMPRFYEIKQRITSVAVSPDSAHAVYSDANGTLWKRRLPK